MPSHNLFITVLKPPTSNGNITVSFESFDADINVAFSATIPVVSLNSDCTSIARTIYNGIASALTSNNANYAGSPRFGHEAPPATFKQIRTDNVIALWSQAQFSVTVDVGNTGAVVVSKPCPMFLTLDEANKLSILISPLTDADGNTLSEESLLTFLIELVSDELYHFLKNPIVLTPHLFNAVTNGVDSVMLPKRPVVWFDTPRARYPGPSVDTLTAIDFSKNSFHLASRIGKLKYTQGSMLVDIGEPFAKDNEASVSYVAGNQSIPASIKKACVQLARQLTNDPNLKLLKGADFSVEFFQSPETVKYIRSSLREFIMAG